MNDMVTYNYRHNEANQENNHDGSSYNYSWNCGVEGPSRRLQIRQMRERQIRNAFLMVLLSQGVPMIYGGMSLEIHRTEIIMPIVRIIRLDGLTGKH